MDVSPISFTASAGTALKIQRTENAYTRPEREYSPHQTLWNAYGDSLVALNDFDKQLLSLSEQIYKTEDDETKQKLIKLREAISERRDVAQANYDECKTKLYEYRAKHGFDE